MTTCVTSNSMTQENLFILSKNLFICGCSDELKQQLEDSLAQEKAAMEEKRAKEIKVGFNNVMTNKAI